MTLQTTIDVNLAAVLASALDLGAVQYAPTINKRVSLLTGTGNGQADMIFTDTRTVAASGTDALDLAGSLVGPFGNTLTFVKIKGLLVRAAAGNTNSCVINRPASNGVPIFSAASDAIPLGPGGVFLWVQPNAGVTVTAGTGDLINIDNSGAGTSVTYDVAIIGTSA